MSVPRDYKVTFRKEAYSGLSINQDKTGKLHHVCLGVSVYTFMFRGSRGFLPNSLQFIFMPFV
jgi:hypothetical protein